MLEVPLASIAVILSVVSFRTLRAMKHLSVGKSFWFPMLFSGICFFAASITAILNELGLLPISYITEVVSTSRLLAICFLAGGVYTYSRKITKNLLEKLPLPEGTSEVSLESTEETKPPQSIIERLDEKAIDEEVTCKHELGYLRTLTKLAHIPEECLGCHRVIECKYSISNATTTETEPDSDTVATFVLSDDDLKKKNEHRSE
jgi:hypothetical protein